MVYTKVCIICGKKFKTEDNRDTICPKDRSEE